MKRTILRSVILATALTWALGVAIVPAHAASVTTSVGTNVSGGIGSGVIHISAHASNSDLLANLKSVRVSARNGSDPFTCLVEWSTSADSFDRATDWDSTKFRTQSDAAGCPSGSGYGAYTHNASLQIKVEAWNTSSAYSSSTTTISLNNASSAPTWASSPTVSGAAQRQPVVTVSWNSVPEPDIVEYHFVRRNPDGSAVEFAVSASSPQTQGCSASNGVFTCHDSSFQSTGFGGTYSYWVVAYRSSPSDADHCSAQVGGGANCIQSPLSTQQSVSMSEPAPSPSGTPSSGGGSGGSGGSSSTGSHVIGGPRPTGVTPSTTSNDTTTQSPQVLGSTVNREQFCFTCGTYGKTLPYGNNTLPGDGASAGVLPGANGQNPILAAGPQLATGTGGADPKQLWTSVAAGLVLLLTAAHVARVLRASAA